MSHDVTHILDDVKPIYNESSYDVAGPRDRIGNTSQTELRNVWALFLVTPNSSEQRNEGVSKKLREHKADKYNNYFYVDLALRCQLNQHKRQLLLWRK